MVEIDGVIGVNRFGERRTKTDFLAQFANSMLGSGARFNTTTGAVLSYGTSNVYDTRDSRPETVNYYYGIEARDQSIISSVQDALAEQMRITDAARVYYQFQVDRYLVEKEEDPNNIDLHIRNTDAAWRTSVAMAFLNNEEATFNTYINTEITKVRNPADNSSPLTNPAKSAELIRLINGLDTVRRTQAANIEHGLNVEVSEVDLTAIKSKITALFNGSSLENLQCMDKVFLAEKVATERRVAYTNGGTYNNYDANGNVVGEPVTVTANTDLADFWTYQATIQKQLKDSFLGLTGGITNASTFKTNFDALMVKRDALAAAGGFDKVPALGTKAEYANSFLTTVKAKVEANENEFLLSLAKARKLVNTTRDQIISNKESIDMQFDFAVIEKYLGENGGSVSLDNATQVAELARRLGITEQVLPDHNRTVLTIRDQLAKYDVTGSGSAINIDDIRFINENVLSENKDRDALKRSLDFIDTRVDKDISADEIAAMFTNFRASVGRSRTLAQINAIPPEYHAADVDKNGRVDFNDFNVLMTVVARSQHLDEFATRGDKALNVVVGEIKRTQASLDQFSGVKYQYFDAMNTAESSREYDVDRNMMLRNAWSEQVTSWGAVVDNHAAWALMLNADRFIGSPANTEAENQFEAHYTEMARLRRELTEAYARGDDYWLTADRKYTGSVDQKLMTMYKEYDQAWMLLCGGRTEVVDMLGSIRDDFTDVRQEFYGHYYGMFGMDREKEVASLKLKEYHVLHDLRSGLWSQRSTEWSPMMIEYFEQHVSRIKEHVDLMEKYIREHDPVYGLDANNKVIIIDPVYQEMMKDLDDMSKASGYFGIGNNGRSGNTGNFAAISTVLSGAAASGGRPAITGLDRNRDNMLTLEETINVVMDFRAGRTTAGALGLFDVNGSGGEPDVDDLYQFAMVDEQFLSTIALVDELDTNDDNAFSLSESASALSGLARILGSKKSVEGSAYNAAYDLNKNGEIDEADYTRLVNVTGMTDTNFLGNIVQRQTEIRAKLDSANTPANLKDQYRAISANLLAIANNNSNYNEQEQLLLIEKVLVPLQTNSSPSELDLYVLNRVSEALKNNSSITAVDLDRVKAKALFDTDKNNDLSEAEAIAALNRMGSLQGSNASVDAKFNLDQSNTVIDINDYKEFARLTGMDGTRLAANGGQALVAKLFDAQIGISNRRSAATVEVQGFLDSINSSLLNIARTNAQYDDTKRNAVIERIAGPLNAILNNPAALPADQLFVLQKLAVAAAAQPARVTEPGFLDDIAFGARIDTNFDNVLDASESAKALSDLGAVFGKRSTDPAYNAQFDLNRDNIIDAADFRVIKEKFSVTSNNPAGKMFEANALLLSKIAEPGLNSTKADLLSQIAASVARMLTMNKNFSAENFALIDSQILSPLNQIVSAGSVMDISALINLKNLSAHVVSHPDQISQTAFDNVRSGSVNETTVLITQAQTKYKQSTKSIKTLQRRLLNLDRQISRSSGSRLEYLLQQRASRVAELNAAYALNTEVGGVLS